MSDRKNIKTAMTLSAFAALMFGFGYALAPMYTVLCKVWGLNGKTDRISETAAHAYTADTQRQITVEFDGNINSELSWAFRPVQRKISVHPGQIYEVLFDAENLTDRWTAGQAVPSVAPSLASIYFNKTECFCFTRQTLGPHEKKRMPVRFIVDPAIPDHIGVLTLSYTFFRVPASGNGLAGESGKPDTNI